MKMCAFAIVAIVALAACRAPQPAPTSPPTSSPVSPVRSTQWNGDAPPMETLGTTAPARFIELPPWMFAMGGDALRYELEPARMPPTFVKPQPARPHVGSDALVLADRALERHDAFDAAAQYRALLTRAPADARRYIELQLARAEIELDHVEDADARLRALLTVEDAITWPAAYQLATMRVTSGRDVAAAVFADLGPRLGERRDDLTRLLLELAPNSQLPDLVALLQIDTNPAHQCLYDLLVFERSSGLPSWAVCPAFDATRTRPTAPGAEQKQLLELEIVMGAWAQGVHENRSKEGGWWLSIALRAAEIPDAPDEPTKRMASWIALAACYNAQVASTRTGGFEYDPARREEILRLIHPDYRADAERILRALWRDGGPSGPSP